jgi:biotin carboxyl carrier protein
MPYRAVVKPGTNRLFVLSREEKTNPAEFKYTFHYIKGCINPTVDTNFTYILPIAAGKQGQAYEMNNTPSNLARADNPSVSAQGELTPPAKDWYVIRLKMKPGDTIYAARRGTVTEVEDQSGLNDASGSSGGSENYVEIYQADCSFGHYGVLRKSSALVKPGQMVEAGQPIGLVGGDQYGRGSEARFSVYYNREEDIDGTNKKIYWEYVPLQFWTKENGKGKLKHGAIYTSEHPLSVISQEMPKPKKGKPKRKA